MTRSGAPGFASAGAVIMGDRPPYETPAARERRIERRRQRTPEEREAQEQKSEARRRRRAAESPSERAARLERVNTQRENLKPPEIPRALHEAIAAALASPALDPAQVETLAHRDTFADVVNFLTFETGWPGAATTPLSVLWPAADSEIVRCNRLAQGFGFGEVPDGERRDRAWLRAQGSDAARIALSILGECEWTTATPRERAGYLLGRIIDARRAKP